MPPLLPNRPRNVEPSPRENHHANLHLSVVGLLIVTCLTALLVAFICEFVLNSFQDSHAMAMLITDAGVKSDDKNLERNLTSATQALVVCRDLGWALGVGALGCGLAVFIRSRRQNAS